MSINSKAKRDARRKQQPKRTPAPPPPPIVAHARLLDAEDGVVGGGGLRGDEWVLVFGGKVAATTDSAAMLLAMLHHACRVRARVGETLRVDASPVLREAATREADHEGRTLDEHLAALEAERREHALRKQAVPTGTAH